MICEHLAAVEAAIKAGGIEEVFRGKPWSDNCREWVYFECFIDTAEVRKKFALEAFVVDHAHRGTHDGQERGLVCQACWDAVIGYYEEVPGKPVFRG